MNETTNNIIKKINKEEEISPFLFIGKNMEIVNQEVLNIWKKILSDYKIPEVYLYTLKDNWENIKVKEVREFIQKSNTKSWFEFQIFFIENIWRLTTQASNSLLKFFEEPGSWNIIFCTNSWENNVLETILSRVQIINFWWKKIEKNDEYLQNVIKKFLQNKDNELIQYLFSEKKEKEEYLDFLENLLKYCMKNKTKTDFLEELNNDINLIKSNNLNPKYFSDKWIIKIK